MIELLRRLRYLVTRRRQERELEDEMEFHREMMAREGRAASFGNTLRLREDSRDAWGWLWLEQLAQDLAYGVRVLRRTPVFTISAVLILALGIGVNLAAFHVFNVAVFRPLPVRDPDTIVRFIRQSPQMFSDGVSYPVLAYVEEHSSALAAVLGSTSLSVVFGRESGEEVRVKFVTANYFHELGAVPARGRLLDESTAAGNDPVVVLSHGFWQRKLGGDSSSVSATVYLNRKPATVIGVVSEEFIGLDPSPTDLWLLVRQVPYFVEGSTLLTDFHAGSMTLYGRMKPGMSPQATEEALLPLMQELHRQQPDAVLEGEKLAAHPGAYLAALDLDRARPEEMALAAMAGLLMLLILGVACANLGNLQMARTVAREREIAIRSALGAGGARITRQLFTESLLLAAMGTLVGMALSATGFRVLVTMIDASGFFLFALDYRVFLFAFAIAFLATLLFGLAPAVRATRPIRSFRRPGRVFIAAQIAASCVLLIVAGLLIRSMQQALGQNLGFEFDRVIAIDPRMDSHGFQPAEASAYWDSLRAQLQSVPGVESTALCTYAPFGTRTSIYTNRERTYTAYSSHVDPGYFFTLAIPLLSGRNFAPGEKNAVIVGEKLARIRWPGENPLGKPWSKGGPVVVGVAAPARTVGASDAESTEIYFPLRASDQSNGILLVRTAVPPETVLPQIRALVESQDRRLIPSVSLLKNDFYLRLEASEQAARVVSALGILAALLAAAGVYGQVCYSVAQRQKEIGVRVALGARPSNVVGLVLRQFYGPFGVGALIGIGIAAGVSVVLRRELYGLSHLDPASYAGAVGLLLVLAVLAALAPAQRALRVDPLEVLRHE